MLDGETVIDGVMAPFDHAYDEMPAPDAVSVTGLPHDDTGPKIETTGAGLTVTAIGEDVVEHPDASVTVTV